MQTALLESAPAIPVSEPAFRGYVLIVDDEEQNRMLLRDPLEAQGYEVVEAEDGERALKCIACRAPDVVLLDVMMPSMDGFAVCRWIKSRPELAHIPVLMVTALSERHERLKGISAGANDFLNKPVDMHDLSLRVANAVGSKLLYDQLQLERQRSEKLLLNVLPPAIAARMKAGEETIADFHPEATVLFADLVGFTLLSAHIAPEQVVCLLNEIFSLFDAAAAKLGLEKIKTVGDTYIVAAGVPEAQPDDPGRVLEMALSIKAELARFNHSYNTSVQVRVGICTGPVVAGVIGRQKFAYDIWGDTVNVAARLEAFGEPGTIHVSEQTYEKLKGRFRFEMKPRVSLKGKGETTVYRVIEK